MSQKLNLFFFLCFIPLRSMKRKQLILSFSFAVTILFSILFQSIHSYEHIAKQLSEKQCHHKYSDPSGEITHQHHDFEVCFVCNFAFESYIAPEVFQFQFHSFNRETPYFFPFSEKIFSVSTDSCYLRGPPSVILS